MIFLQESVNSEVIPKTPDSCFSYTNDACLSSLQSIARKHGINATGDSIMVQQNMQAGSVDPNVIFTVFNNHPSITEECQIAGLPLFCQYFYPICNPVDGSIISITEEQCTLVTEGVCREALQFARAVPSFNIPDCSEFDSMVVNVTEENITEVASPFEMHNTNSNVSNITCDDQFDLRCGMCIPACNRFSETSEERQKTIDIFFIIAALTCIIGGTLVIIVSILRRNIM